MSPSILIIRNHSARASSSSQPGGSGIPAGAVGSRSLIVRLPGFPSRSLSVVGFGFLPLIGYSIIPLESPPINFAELRAEGHVWYPAYHRRDKGSPHRSSFDVAACALLPSFVPHWGTNCRRAIRHT